MHARRPGAEGAKTAVRRRDDVLAADPLRVLDEPLADELRRFDEEADAIDDTGDEDLPVRELHVLPDFPFMGVPRVGRLDRVGLRLHLEDEVHDLLEGHVAADSGVRVGLQNVPFSTATEFRDRQLSVDGELSRINRVARDDGALEFHPKRFENPGGALHRDAMIFMPLVA